MILNLVRIQFYLSQAAGKWVSSTTVFCVGTHYYFITFNIQLIFFL